MNSVEKEIFELLTNDRLEMVKNFNKPSAKGIWKGITDKYSEGAHFIYELLQNADDAGAEEVKFVLSDQELVFIHDGKIHFSVTDPQNEEEDGKNGKQGHINAITGIGFSSKGQSEKGNKIGKFGVGFKAVFQYTKTPHIYDPEFRFKIENYIVPIYLENDYQDRKENETIFVFPFDRGNVEPEKAYVEIEERLNKLNLATLFLSTLKKITVQTDNYNKVYGEKILKEDKFKDIYIKKIEMLDDSQNEDKNTLWLFSRLQEGRKYSIGFFSNKDNMLIPMDKPAFCYFPTKVTTGLKFIIHAPFLLTDSREGIKAKEEHNIELIEKLADLSKDALLYLRDAELPHRLITDEIINIIPIDEKDFPENSDTISFRPFYNKIKALFQNERILPTADGYAKKEEAYWASVTTLPEIFDDEKLKIIVNNDSVKWVFITKGSDSTYRSNTTLYHYISDLVSEKLDENTFLSSDRKINVAFIERQDTDWLHILYKWLSETENRMKQSRMLPVFLNQKSEAVSAYDYNNHLILFLNEEGIEGSFNTIRKDLLEVEATREFVKRIGIKAPSRRDYIYNTILPEYNSNEGIDTTPHFKLFFDYYCECQNEEVSNFLEEIRNVAFIKGKTQKEDIIYRRKASDLYFPTEQLTKYFETKPDTPFVLFDSYKELVGEDKIDTLQRFFVDLGVKELPMVYECKISYREGLPYDYSTRYKRYIEPQIDGCIEILKEITQGKSLEKSISLWRILNDISDKLQNFVGRYEYFFHSPSAKNFVPAIKNHLQQYRWISNQNGDFFSPSEISVLLIHESYERTPFILNFLGISEKEEGINLTESQRKDIELARKIKETGYSEEKILELIEADKQRNQVLSLQSFGSSQEIEESFEQAIGKLIDWQKQENSSLKTVRSNSKRNVSKVTKDIIKRVSYDSYQTYHDDFEDEKDADKDEYSVPSVDWSKRVEKEKEKSAQKIDELAYQEELNTIVQTSEKYSYSWFKALLELEIMNVRTNDLTNREISISFGKVELEQGTQKTLILSNPNRYIPQYMEELSDIHLDLKLENFAKKVAIDVVNVKEYTLRIKLKSHVDITNIDFSKVIEARIDAKSPIFLLDELKKGIEELSFPGDYNLKNNLTKDIEFVFGPPGTGKTTFLSKKIIEELIDRNEAIKILVLTPTNKAADVLVKRIMEFGTENQEYKKWLIRFGGTGEECIEQQGILKDKTFNIKGLSKAVLVTTIARFPYDYFMIDQTRMFIKELKWDYIVIDEASMIPLVSIMYPLYKKTPEKFIIAGDPFQIEPITAVNHWKDENIYKMVHLDRFDSPGTEPHPYEVKLLTTQYRSIPSIGRIFSKLAYNGILEHSRGEECKKSLHIEDKIDLASLNIIKFPVSQFESIYRSKRLNQSSSYHIYSSLFVVEFAIYLSNLIHSTNREKITIGVIAPYRAQADIIDKIIGTMDIPDRVTIQVGTIHGFQGDECDIVFVMLNTPPTISESKEMFLNKMNIINVAISRAKDYLFLVMPNDDTIGIENLKLVKRVENLMKEGEYKEYKSQDLEELMFSTSTHIEDNAFSTGHQNINIYVQPEKKYEIRAEERAVDIQIHNKL